MTPPRTILGTMMSPRWVRDPWPRRIVIAVAALVLAILTLWPRIYLARAELIPDQNTGGLPSILSGSGGGALASLGSLIGARQSIESDLSIARSQAVAEDTASRLMKRGFLKKAGSLEKATAAVRAGVDVESITGSILQITVTDHDPAYAKTAVEDYVAAVRGRLESISVEQSTLKKTIAANRMAEASLNLAKAQAALDRFRLANRLADPKTELGAAISLVTSLQARLQAEQASLATLETFATGDNIQVQASRAQIAALSRQIAEAQAAANGSQGPSVGGMTPIISQYENLYRDENYAEAEYEVYKKYLDVVTAEFLSSNINMSLIGPPYVDSDRHYNVHWMIALMLWLLLGVLAEFYISRPPPGWVAHEAQ